MPDVWESLRKPAKTWEDYPPPVLDPDTGPLTDVEQLGGLRIGDGGGGSRPHLDPKVKTQICVFICGFLGATSAEGGDSGRHHPALRFAEVPPVEVQRQHERHEGFVRPVVDLRLRLEHLEPVTPSENSRRVGKSRAFRAQQRREHIQRVHEVWAALAPAVWRDTPLIGRPSGEVGCGPEKRPAESHGERPEGPDAPPAKGEDAPVAHPNTDTTERTPR